MWYGYNVSFTGTVLCTECRFDTNSTELYMYIQYSQVHTVLSSQIPKSAHVL